MNVGRLTFTYTDPMDYLPPVADAGPDTFVLAPATTSFLDGSGSSTASSGRTLTYRWEQIAGPAMATLSDSSASDPGVSGLTADGIYRFRLTVQDGSRWDVDEVELLCGATGLYSLPLEQSSSDPIASSGNTGQLQ